MTADEAIDARDSRRAVIDEPQVLPWEVAGWLERVESSVGIQLGRVGLEPRRNLELVRTRPWAAVARVATTAGDVWFKERDGSTTNARVESLEDSNVSTGAGE